MGPFQIQGAQITAIRGVVPSTVANASEEGRQRGLSSEYIERLRTVVGLHERRVATFGTTALDLGAAAAEALIVESNIDRTEIDVVIFVTQTPDHFQPANACLLHGRLGMDATCAAFDVNLGCSGFVYGLWLSQTIIASGGGRRILLVTADTLSRCVYPGDHASASLFGDAAVAVLIEASPDPVPAWFSLHTDGSKADAIVQPAGAFRMPLSAETEHVFVDIDGNHRRQRDLAMKGDVVFSFAVTRIPECIGSLMDVSTAASQLDALVLHQANRYIIDTIARRVALPAGCHVLSASIERFGNTSAASIPLAIACELGAALFSNPLEIILCGFGTGLSWAAARVTLPRMKVCTISDLA